MGGRILSSALVVAAVAALAAASSGAGRQVLTEFGATRAVWRAHHTPDPKYTNACCFLPRQRDGHDRYYAVLYGDGTRVFSFEMAFAPTIPLGLARLVAKKEAGPGARLVYDVKKADCEQLQFKSALLSRVLRSAVLVELSRSDVGGAPNGHVGDMILSPASVGDKIDC